MAAELAVSVTMAHWLSASDALDVGLPPVAIAAGATVEVPLSGAVRLITAGLTTINPTDTTAIEALFDNPTFVLHTQTSNTYVGPQLPVSATPPYVWFQTGLAPDGAGTTLWIEALFDNPTFVLHTQTSNTYVGPQLPVSATPPYVWFQTGLAPDGAGTTLWIEDGT